MVLQEKIPIPVSPNIATFDFTDIAGGKVWQRLDAAHLSGNASAPNNYILTKNTFYSMLAQQTQAAAGSTLDIDFDQTLTLPLNIKGEAVVNFLATMTIDSTDAGTRTGTWTVDLRKYSGTTETSLASGNNSFTKSSTTGGSTDVQNMAIYLDVPKTHFKRDDILRLNMLVEGSGGATRAGFFCDPANRTITPTTGTATTTRCTLDIPIKP